MKHHLFKKIFLFSIVFVLTIPLFVTCLKSSALRFLGKQILNEPELVGVTVPIKSPGRTIKTILDGSWESYIEQHFANELIFRKTSTRVYNQFLWSVFGSVDLPGVVVGKNHSLFEREYIYQYFSEANETTITQFKDDVTLLSKLHSALEKRGIPMFVWITPSKAVYYPQQFPSAYNRYLSMKQNGKYEQADYEVFTKLLGESDVPFYSGDKVLQDLVKQGQPVFVPSGIHWTSYPMAEWINGFQDILGKQLGKKLGKLEATVNDTNKYALGIDSDLLLLANTFSVSPYYDSIYIHFTSENGEVAPNLFICGGSFNTRILQSIYAPDFNTSTSYIWGNGTEWSWYDSEVRGMPGFFQTWEPVSANTDDYASILKKDAIVIEINQSMNKAAQLQFAQNLLNYMNEGK
jgi:hypothetical protein